MKLLSAVVKRITAHAMLYEAQAKAVDNDRLEKLRAEDYHEAARKLNNDMMQQDINHRRMETDMERRIKGAQASLEELKLQYQRDIIDRDKAEPDQPSEYDQSREDMYEEQSTEESEQDEDLSQEKAAWVD